MQGRLFSALTATAVLVVLGATSAAAAPIAGEAGRGARVSQPRVRMTLPTTVVLAGQPFQVTAAVTPRAAHLGLVLQRRGEQRWRNLAVAETTRSGTAIFRVGAQQPGTLVLRVLKRATATTPAAYSASRRLSIAPLYAGAPLGEGASGARVLALQQRLTSLGYWVGTPNGVFGDATQQAVYAIQKAANLSRSGVVNPATVNALAVGVVPHARSTKGDITEVDLERDLVLFVDNGVVEHVLNTSSGGGYTYQQDGTTQLAITPKGQFRIGRVVDGLVTDSLGSLWRPRFFYEGFAIHGDSYVPPFPVSHGCVRVSNEAIDWIWAANLLPVGHVIWVY